MVVPKVWEDTTKATGSRKRNVGPTATKTTGKKQKKEAEAKSVVEKRDERDVQDDENELVEGEGARRFGGA